MLEKTNQKQVLKSLNTIYWLSRELVANFVIGISSSSTLYLIVLQLKMAAK